MDNLQRLLIEGTEYSPNYLPSNNSDHLPMTLCAMSGLGANAAFLAHYRQQYSQRLHRISNHDAQEMPSSELAASCLAQERDITSDWRQGIGRSACYPVLLAWFTAQVATKGIAASVSEYLPEFVSSIALQAFHPIIRLGYAIDFESKAETAAALAYLASSHRPFPLDTDNLCDMRGTMQKQAEAGAVTFKRPTFSGKLLQQLEDDDYPQGQVKTIEEAAAVAFDLFRSSRNFFALHLVTATQAMRICMQFIDEKQALASLTSALLAAHRAVGSPHFSPDNVLDVVHIDEEHNYKYAWACLSEYRHLGDSRYLAEISAMRDRGLIAPWSAVPVL